MAERGNTKHGSELDDQMKHEAEGLVRGTKPPHVEEGRETEPFPDETDPQEVLDALNPETGKGEAGGGPDD